MAAERKFWEVLAEGEYQRLVLVRVSLVLTVLVIALAVFLVRLSIRPKQVVVVPEAVVDLANFTPVSAEKGFCRRRGT